MCKRYINSIIIIIIITIIIIIIIIKLQVAATASIKFKQLDNGIRNNAWFCVLNFHKLSTQILVR